MARTKKSTKRSKGKKSATRAKGGSAAKTGRTERGARKSSGTSRAGLKAVRKAGEKTWKVLKKTTSQVVEGVKDTLGR
jgi:hypothetical protein